MRDARDIWMGRYLGPPHNRTSRSGEEGAIACAEHIHGILWCVIIAALNAAILLRAATNINIGWENIKKKSIAPAVANILLLQSQPVPFLPSLKTGAKWTMDLTSFQSGPFRSTVHFSIISVFPIF